MNDLHAPFFALARPSHLWFELDRFLLINVSSSFLLEYDTIPIFWFLLLVFLHWIYDFLKLIDDIFYFHFLEKLQFLRSFSSASGQTRQACWPRNFQLIFCWQGVTIRVSPKSQWLFGLFQVSKKSIFWWLFLVPTRKKSRLENVLKIPRNNKILHSIPVSY